VAKSGALRQWGRPKKRGVYSKGKIQKGSKERIVEGCPVSLKRRPWNERGQTAKVYNPEGFKKYTKESGGDSVKADAGLKSL